MENTRTLSVVSAYRAAGAERRLTACERLVTSSLNRPRLESPRGQMYADLVCCVWGLRLLPNDLFILVVAPALEWKNRARVASSGGRTQFEI